MKKKSKLIFIAGPCIIESESNAFQIADKLKKITSKYDVDFTFKASFLKANRTSLDSYTGPGIKKGLKILKKIKTKLGLKILSDIHCQNDIEEAAQVLDIIQIPAFLSRQTDLIIKAAKTKKTINIKKAQFMSPDDIEHVIKKVQSTGNKKILVTERGSCFGYNNLVVDFRSFLIMKKFGFPVVYDVTHSLQRPSASGGVSGGDSEFVPPMTFAGIGAGVDGLFMEVHPNPKKALSDSATSFSLNKVEEVLAKALKIREVLNEKN